MTRKLLRLHDVMAIVGLSRSSIYAAIKAGTFPKPTSIGPRAVAWDSTLIAEWVDEKCTADVSNA